MYVWDLKKQINKYNRTEKSLTDTVNKLVVARGEAGGSVGETGKGD